MSANGIIADSASVNKGASMNLVVITTIAAFALVAVAAFFVYRRSVNRRGCSDEPVSMASLPLELPIAADDGMVEMKLMDGRHY